MLRGFLRVELPTAHTYPFLTGEFSQTVRYAGTSNDLENIDLTLPAAARSCVQRRLRPSSRSRKTWIHSGIGTNTKQFITAQ